MTCAAQITTRINYRAPEQACACHQQALRPPPLSLTTRGGAGVALPQTAAPLLRF